MNKKIKLGMTVTCLKEEEAYYSGRNGNPQVIFKPGDIGIVMSVNLPHVRGRESGVCVDFYGPRYAGGPDYHIWRTSAPYGNLTPANDGKLFWWSGGFKTTSELILALGRVDGTHIRFSDWPHTKGFEEILTMLPGEAHIIQIIKDGGGTHRHRVLLVDTTAKYTINGEPVDVRHLFNKMKLLNPTGVMNDIHTMQPGDKLPFGRKGEPKFTLTRKE